MSMYKMSLLTALLLMKIALIKTSAPAKVGQNDANMIQDVIQNDVAKNSQKQANAVEECQMRAMGQSQRIDGITLVSQAEQQKNAEIANQVAAQDCINAKKEQQREISQKIKESVESTLRGVSKKPKSSCVKRLNPQQRECFVKKVIRNFYNEPIWQILIHDNVAELFYQNKVAMMIVSEHPEYEFSKLPGKCFTHFPSATLRAKQNALGNIVSVEGEPASMREKDKKCLPCSNFLKGGSESSVEGKGASCANSCSLADSLLNTESLYESINKPKPAEKKDKPAEKKDN